MSTRFHSKEFRELILQYKKLFGDVYYLDPSGELVLDPVPDNEMVYYVPEWETEDGFREKLEQSMQKKKNVFLEAYKDYKRDPYSDQDAMY